MKEAPQILLFLRNLVSIKLYVWEPNQKSPTVVSSWIFRILKVILEVPQIFKSKIANASKDLAAKRLHFVSLSNELVKKGADEQARKTISNDDKNFVAYRLRIAVEQPKMSFKCEEWIVGQMFGGVGGKCLQMAYDSLMVWQIQGGGGGGTFLFFWFNLETYLNIG